MKILPHTAPYPFTLASLLGVSEHVVVHAVGVVCGLCLGGTCRQLGWGHRAHPVWDRAGAEANELQLEQSGVPNAARVPHPDNVGERLLELGPHELEERASACVAVAQEGAADFEDSQAPAQALLAGGIAGVDIVGRAGYVGWRGGEVARRRVEVGLWEARVEVAVALAEATLVVVALEEGWYVAVVTLSEPGLWSSRNLPLEATIRDPIARLPPDFF